MAIRTLVTPKAGAGVVNLRSAGKIDPANIVGMINERFCKHPLVANGGK